MDNENKINMEFSRQFSNKISSRYSWNFSKFIMACNPLGTKYRATHNIYNIYAIQSSEFQCCCKGSWSTVTYSVRHQGTHYGNMYTWIIWQQKIQKTMIFVSQKVVTTGGVFDMCELCYSSLIHFQEHCFPCPLFQTTQPRFEPT